MEFKQANVLMRCLSGSQAYGTSTPTSDVDIRGIFAAPEKYIRTPFLTVNELDIPEEEDGKLFELNNFMRLFMDSSPNIMELLFVDESDILDTSPAYEYLRENRASLLSKKAAFTFSGYAMSQLKRIKGHNKWINNPQPEKSPVRKDYLKLVHNFTPEKVLDKTFNIDHHLVDHVLIPYGNDIYGALFNKGSKAFNEDGSLKKVEYSTVKEEDKKTKPSFILKMCEDVYKSDKENWKNYWNWKKNRNEKRHQLEVDYNYDTKNGMHTVRLMKIAEELLTTGQILVKRPDAEELLAIRNGAWSYEKMLKWATEKDELIRGKLYKESSLPNKPNINKAIEVLMKAQDIAWKNC